MFNEEKVRTSIFKDKHSEIRLLHSDTFTEINL
jgi:hypothetical protein